jgi:hypothetical protein
MVDGVLQTLNVYPYKIGKRQAFKELQGLKRFRQIFYSLNKSEENSETQASSS